MIVDAKVRGALLLSLALASCTPKIVVDFDKNTDFTNYHTYAWGKGTPAKSPFVDARIVAAIDEQLTSKGYQKVDANPDMLVSYHAATGEEVHYNTTSFGYGYGPAWGPGYGWYRGGYGWGGGVSTSTTSPTTVTIGTVVVDMYDAKDKRMIWRGRGSDTVLEDPAENEAQIREGAEKMFEKFPPPKK
ncbi:MAG: DUF4136 domain-containing protein [Nitrospiraceae bacterium]